MCSIKLWKATATAPERRSTKLTDKRQLCAALPCVALQHPVRILPRKTVLILKINQLFSTKACRKKARLGSLGTWSAHCYDNLIRSGTIYPDMVFTRRRWPIVSVSSSKVSTFSIVFVSSSKVCGYGSSSCKQEAYPERFLSGLVRFRTYRFHIVFV